jgi:hypothetical protein
VDCIHIVPRDVGHGDHGLGMAAVDKMTSKQKVLAKYPNAFAHSPMGGWWYIDISRDTAMLGEGPDEESAWNTAALWILATSNSNLTST